MTRLPFNPPIVPERMTWTASSLRTFRRDKRKFFWKYMMRLTPVYRDKHLMIGSAFHECIAKWYRSKRVSIDLIVAGVIKSLIEELEKNVKYYDQDEYDEILTSIEAIGGMVLGYVQHYAEDKRDWTIRPDRVEVTMIQDMGPCDYAGQADLILDDGLVEHKTAGMLSSAYFERLPLDTQVRGYLWLVNKEFSTNHKRVTYNVVRKPKLRRKGGESVDEFSKRVCQDFLDRPEFYFHREPLHFVKSDIEAFRRDVLLTDLEYQAIRKRGGFEDPKAWAANDSECNAYFRLCPYFSGCLSGLSGLTPFVTQGESMHSELKDLE